MGLVIVDLDNCISDDGWRLGHIDYKTTNMIKRFHNYHLLAPFDKLANRDIVDQIEHKIIVITARPQLYRAATKEWLKRNGVQADGLLMRAVADLRGSVDLKSSMVDAVLEWAKVDIGAIHCAYDDREDIVKMYRDRGITAEVRAIHNNDVRML